MKKKLLAVFAHPDDEAFGPGGTLALYAKKGVEIHLLCATSGDGGEVSDKDTSDDGRLKGSRNDDSSEVKRVGSDKDTSGVTPGGSRKVERIGREFSNISIIREKELLKSAKILGIKKVEFLGFPDGHLSNSIYHSLADKIIKKIKEFKPQVVLTLERLGISGHLDHIAVSMITTYSFLKTKQAKKLYYHCWPSELRVSQMDDYFIYFPEGCSQGQITTRIDISSVWDKRIRAVKAHQSQLKDGSRVSKLLEKGPKIEFFILHHHRGVKIKFPETDLFTGVSYG